MLIESISYSEISRRSEFMAGTFPFDDDYSLVIVSVKNSLKNFLTFLAIFEYTVNKFKSIRISNLKLLLYRFGYYFCFLDLCSRFKSAF